jgi:phage tail protein X
MTRTILLLALVVLITAAVYIIKDIYTAWPVTVAATEDWLPLDTWHWHEPTIDCVEYTVGCGDTLWGIVSRYYPDAHTGEVVWAIRKVNELLGPGGPILQPGQVLWLPDPMIYGAGKR